MKLTKLMKLMKLSPKEHLRHSIKERASRLTPEQRRAESRSIARRIKENLPEDTLTICAYYPMPTEADLRELIEELLENGHRLYLPKFTKTHFEFRGITSLAGLVTGKFGLQEPPLSAPLLDLKNVNVALVPGVAFDRLGNRLGRGNGGFDRWIGDLKKVNPEAVIWGITLEHQLVDTVPTEVHDQRVDAIVTAREMYPSP